MSVSVYNEIVIAFKKENHLNCFISKVLARGHSFMNYFVSYPDESDDTNGRVDPRTVFIIMNGIYYDKLLGRTQRSFIKIYCHTKYGTPETWCKFVSENDDWGSPIVFLNYDFDSELAGCRAFRRGKRVSDRIIEATFNDETIPTGEYLSFRYQHNLIGEQFYLKTLRLGEFS